MPRLHGYRDSAEQRREESLRRLRDTEGPLLEALRRAASLKPEAIVLSPPRRVTSTAIAKVGGHGVFAFTITAISMLVAFAPMLVLCAAAPLLIYVWWLVTSETIQAAARLDEHPIPPARVLSEGPR